MCKEGKGVIEAKGHLVLGCPTFGVGATGVGAPYSGRLVVKLWFTVGLGLLSQNRKRQTQLTHPKNRKQPVSNVVKLWRCAGATRAGAVRDFF